MNEVMNERGLLLGRTNLREAAEGASRYLRGYLDCFFPSAHAVVEPEGKCFLICLRCDERFLSSHLQGVLGYVAAAYLDGWEHNTCQRMH
jgi:hypothetical protein